MKNTNWTKVDAGWYRNKDGYDIILHRPSGRWLLVKDAETLFNFASKRDAQIWYQTHFSLDARNLMG